MLGGCCVRGSGSGTGLNVSRASSLVSCLNNSSGSRQLHAGLNLISDRFRPVFKVEKFISFSKVKKSFAKIF